MGARFDPTVSFPNLFFMVCGFAITAVGVLVGGAVAFKLIGGGDGPPRIFVTLVLLLVFPLAVTVAAAVTGGVARVGPSRIAIALAVPPGLVTAIFLVMASVSFATSGEVMLMFVTWLSAGLVFVLSTFTFLAMLSLRGK